MKENNRTDFKKVWDLMPKIKTRETVGKISSELLNKIPDTTDPIALERAMHGEYVDNIDGCVRVSRNDYPNNFS